MKIATYVRFQMTENIGEYILVNKDEFEYEGPVELADRSVQKQASTDASTAGQNAAQAGGEAQTEHNILDPFYNNEMNAQHLFTPQQNEELLTAAQAPLGAVAGDTAHQAELQSARTRNASGFAKDLDQANRDKMKGMAGASEGIAAQDITGAKNLNQEGATGMSHLFNTDTENQLKSMGLQNEDLNTDLAAGRQGWLQNLDQTIKSVGSLGGSAGLKGIPGL